MPPVVAVVAGSIAAGLVTGTLAVAGVALTGLTLAIVTAGITTVVGGLVAKALAGGYNTADLGTAVNMSRDAAADREYIYGLARSGGTIAFVENSGDDNEYLWLVIIYADHEIDSFQGLYIDDELVTTSGGAVTSSPYNGFVSFWDHLGTDSQTADANLVAASDGRWTSDHRLRGCAYTVYRLLYDRDVFPTGLPNISRIIKGRKVYDPRLDSTVSGGSGSHRSGTPSTWEWSDNALLCALDYQRDALIGPGLPMAAFDPANLIASANTCDETVSVKAGGSITRYACNGIVNSALSHGDVLDLMTRQMAGEPAWTGGVLRFIPGAYESPSLALTTDDIVSIKWKPAPSRRELVNQVKGLFIDPSDGYQPANYPAVEDSSAVSADGGEVFWLDLDLPLERDHRRAQRIAAIAQKRARLRGTGTIRTTMKALKLRAGNTCTVTDDEMGWSAKVLRVKSMTINLPRPGDAGSDGADAEAWTIDLQVEEEASASYAWTAASDEQDLDTQTGGPPVVTIPLDLSAPANLTAVAATFVGSDGSKLPAIKVTWDDPSPFIISTDVQISPDNGTTWLPYGTVPAESGDGAIITGLVKGTTYKIRAAHINQVFIVSAWATSGSISITDSTIAGTIVNQGDLALLDSVDTSEINPNAVTDNTGTDRTTVALNEGGWTTVWDLAVTAPAGYDVDVTFMFSVGGSGFGDRVAYEYKVERVDIGPTTKFAQQGAPTLFDELSRQSNVVPFIDPDIATANPTYRLSVYTAEAGWVGTVTNLQARVFVVKR